jgi:hypothetical protein
LFTSVIVTRDKFIAGINDTGDKFLAGVVDTAEQLIAGVMIREYLREFSKKFRTAPMEYLGSVSCFQEKEKRGEMITKNDNIK